MPKVGVVVCASETHSDLVFWSLFRTRGPEPLQLCTCGGGGGVTAAR